MTAARSIVALLSLASVAAVVVAGVAGPPAWRFASLCDNRDTLTYYYAARAALDGLGAYDTAAIQRGYGVFAWYVYPLPALPLFLPLTLAGYGTAVAAFNLLKLAAVAALVWQWRRCLPALRGDVVFPLFAIAGLGATLMRDYCSGNVATFEALALWVGISFALRGQWTGSVPAILLAGWCKPVWLVFLALPPILAPGRRAAWRASALAVALVGIVALAWWILAPDSVGEWLAHVRGTVSLRYSIYELFKRVRLALGGEAGPPLLARPEVYVYAVALIAAAAVLWRLWHRAQARPTSYGLVLALVMASVALGPANLSYSWIAALPGVYILSLFLAGKGGWRRIAAFVLMALAVLPQPLLGGLLAWTDLGLATLCIVAAALGALLGVLWRDGDAFERFVRAARQQPGSPGGSGLHSGGRSD